MVIEVFAPERFAVPALVVLFVATKAAILVAFAVALPLTISISPVDKSVIVSEPEFALNVSLPAFPVSESSPAPPVISSSPAPP